MNFLALNDDVKFIISKHLVSDLKIRQLLSRNHDLQKILFNEVVYNDDFCKKKNKGTLGRSPSRSKILAGRKNTKSLQRRGRSIWHGWFN